MRLSATSTGLFLLVLFIGLADFANADIIRFRLTGNGGDGLRGDNINPPTGEPGTGNIGPSGLFIDTQTNNIHIDIHWGSENGYVDLTMPVAMLHLHGPTPSLPPDSFNERADLLINIGNSLNFDPSPTGGGLVEDFFVSNSEIAFIRQGRSYINVHFGSTDTGFLRGYLVQIPEPTGGIALTLSAIMGLAVMRMRRA